MEADDILLTKGDFTQNNPGTLARRMKVFFTVITCVFVGLIVVHVFARSLHRPRMNDQDMIKVMTSVIAS
jgi:hypothetical protein